MSPHNSRRNRREALEDALASRILVLDGAMGTLLFERKLTAADYGGASYEGCHENLNLTRPDVVRDVHRAYYAAGSDIVETNSFQTVQLVLDEFGLSGKSYEIAKAAAAIAREAAAEFSTPQKPRFVAGSMGPTTKSISLRGITFGELEAQYYDVCRGLWDGGADVLLFETCNDTSNIKAGLRAVQRLRRERGERIPVMVSGTIEPMGTMLAGQSADALLISVEHGDLLTMGLNCATGPEFMTDHIRTIHELTNTRVHCYPNAGLPDADTGLFPETPESLARQLDKFVTQGWLNIVGGCCGTTPAHIQAIAQMADGRKPRESSSRGARVFYSGIEAVEAEDSNRPLLVGERTNVIGSRLFKNLIAEEKWEEASEIARRQVRNGAHIIDVCLQSSDRDETQDIPRFYDRLIRKIKAPVMIDTTDPKAVEQSLAFCQGKCIINSVNLEDGEEKFEKMAPVAHSYGAALVVGCIDEDKQQAQAFTRERKLAVALRSVDLLTTKYNIPVTDIVIDPLVFPCATGDENYIGGAVETIEAVRMIREAIPGIKTVLGISNISFGLPAAAREVVNSVFLYYCTKAGLDLAIVNAEKLERFASIPHEERKLAENLLFNSPPPEDETLGHAPEDWREQTREQKAAINQFHIGAISAHFRGSAGRVKQKAADLPLDQRLANYIVEGSRDGLIPDLELKRGEGAAPLDIINGPLMTGMNEVGRLFNNNELIVAEVLQSAEAMKVAVSHLEQYMEKSDSAARGKIVLATVKGDVHDIGKNLVEIILGNNGYTVVNLGIKVPPEELIKAWREHSPDAIGLSGLLVKSAHQMVTTAGDLRDAGIQVPLLVGGAALSDKFTRVKIAPSYGKAVCYAKDAMTGLELMNRLQDPATRETIVASHTHTALAVEEEPAPFASTSEARSTKVRTDIPIPAAPYLERRVRDVPHLTELWSYINPYMLFGRHLGFKGNFEQKLAERDPRAIELAASMDEVKHEATTFLRPRAVWQFFEAEREGNSIHLFSPGGSSPIHTFRFGRQPRDNGLCLSDYVLDADDAFGKSRDHIAMFVVTAGDGVRERAAQAKDAGRFLYSHALQALAIETAEGCAEWLHRRIREDWGFPDPPTMTMKERFTSRYRGKRYAFGYSSCPNLEDQAGIWKLLHPEEIGVTLTEGWMMDPEASTSALVFHHPDCGYFTAAATEDETEALVAR